jgi:hypothetical protein
VDDFKDTLKKYPQFFTEDASTESENYKVSLPGTLQLDVDYHLRGGLYANFALQLALTGNGDKPFNNQYYNAVTITPRFESRRFGFYLPLGYNGLTQFTGGASLRVGNLFIGSGSVLSAAVGSSKQADIFMGVHFGSLQKNKRKKNNRKVLKTENS